MQYGIACLDYPVLNRLHLIVCLTFHNGLQPKFWSEIYDISIRWLTILLCTECVLPGVALLIWILCCMCLSCWYFVWCCVWKSGGQQFGRCHGQVGARRLRRSDTILVAVGLCSGRFQCLLIFFCCVTLTWRVQAQQFNAGKTSAQLSLVLLALCCFELCFGCVKY